LSIEHRSARHEPSAEATDELVPAVRAARESATRVLALVPNLYDTVPGQRFRIEQWEPWLRDRGIYLTYSAFESEELRRVLYQPGRTGPKVHGVITGFRRRIAALRRLTEFDMVYLFREAALVGPAFLERWIHHSGVPMVFDFDDAIFLPNASAANQRLSALKCPGKTRTICRLASTVMAGNAYLADYARQFNQAVTVIPTTIDTAKYTLAPREDQPVPVIGWSGSHTTVPYLDGIRRPLQRLAALERFQLRVIGTAEYQVDGLPVVALPWRSETEVADLRPIDIGVMPLSEDRWARGKCGLKALQYMALGIPTICSPVGVNADIIEDGKNGFLAATDDEWVEKLRLLLKSRSLRERIGRAGRATVESRFAASVQVPRVQAVFEQAVRSR
jgi:glycosyltransferase involved in cell wall biosynthesis